MTRTAVAIRHVEFELGVIVPSDELPVDGQWDGHDRCYTLESRPLGCDDAGHTTIRGGAGRAPTLTGSWRGSSSAAVQSAITLLDDEPSSTVCIPNWHHCRRFRRVTSRPILRVGLSRLSAALDVGVTRHLSSGHLTSCAFVCIFDSELTSLQFL